MVYSVLFSRAYDSVDQHNSVFVGTSSRVHTCSSSETSLRRPVLRLVLSVINIESIVQCIFLSPLAWACALGNKSI